MKTKVCIAGATGWVGKPHCIAINETDDLDLVGAHLVLIVAKT